MTFQHINRRLHLYLALGLLPWFTMYGISSAVFTHSQFFNDLDAVKQLPLWSVIAERTVDVTVPDDPGALRELGTQWLADAGVRAPFVTVTRQNNGRLAIGGASFLQATRGTYDASTRKLTIEKRRFRFDQFLTSMHARGGFNRGSALQSSWSVVIDLVCLGMLLWVASGLYMWWGVRGHRRWGALALVAGAASFLVFTLRL